MRRATLLAVVLLALAGCGGSGGERKKEPRPAPAATPQPRPGELKPTQRDAERLAPIIARWVDTLRASDVDRAAESFNLPLIVSQAGRAATLTTRNQVRAFNAALPCGARLLEVQHNGRYVVGTFRLTERPRRTCDAPGQLVRVAFVLRGGRISEWRQVPDRPGAPVGPEAPEPAPTASPEAAPGEPI